MEEKQRMIQEYVPGKQVTLAHLIANPDEVIFEKLGLQAEIKDAIGILTITPSEAAIIAVDIATKAADVQVGFVDRFTRSGRDFGLLQHCRNADIKNQTVEGKYERQNTNC